MIVITAKDWPELRQKALEHSRTTDLYVLATADFGDCLLWEAKRITVNTPGFTVCAGYWLKGTFKPFTEKQLMAYDLSCQTRE